jgi:hypothetical protein
MSLTNRQRYGAIFTGLAIGCVLSALILGKRGLPHPPPPPDPGVIRREVPGIVAQWMEKGQPIEGDFVMSEATGPAAGAGGRVRALVVPGLDEGALIRIEETPAPAGSGKQVQGWKFMFADRVRAQLTPGADTPAMAEALRALGWHFYARDLTGLWVTIALNTHSAESLPLALAKLREWPQWVAAEEPDYLPAPTGDANGPAAN